MTLVIQIPAQYPNVLPTVTVRNPRGIGDEDIQSLLEAIDKQMEERKGESMLFEVIELAKESLTEGNIPRCSCVICLEHFQEGNSFTKTHCYHYFHCHCLARYAHHCQIAHEQEIKKITLHIEKEETKVHCPMCREDITSEILNLKKDNFNTIEEEEELYIQPSEELKKWQVEMDALRQRQAERGGIIDVEANRNKFLLTEDDMRIMLPILRDKKDEKENAAQTDSIRTGRQASDAYGRGRGRGTKGRRHDNRNQYRDDFECNEYKRTGWDAGAHVIERGRGRYFRSDIEKCERNKGYKHDKRDKTQRKGDNVDQSNHRAKKDKKEKDAQQVQSQTHRQDGPSSHVVDQETHIEILCKKDEVIGLKEESKFVDFISLQEGRMIDSGNQDENKMSSRWSGNQEQLDREREDLIKNESEEESSKHDDQHVNHDSKQQEYHRNNSRIEDLRKENITINGEMGKPLSESEIEKKHKSLLQHKRNDEKSHSEQNLKERPCSGYGRYGKWELDSMNRQKNRSYSGHRRGSQNRHIVRNINSESFPRNSKGRPTSQDIHKNSAPADGIEIPFSGDGEEKPSTGGGRDGITLGDDKDGSAFQHNSKDNTNKPSPQQNSSTKNRSPSKFESLRKGRPLEDHGKRNDFSNRSHSGYKRYEKGRFYSRHNYSDHLHNYDEKRVQVKSVRDNASHEMKVNAFKRDIDEVQTKDHIKSKEDIKEERNASRKMGERGLLIRDKSGYAWLKQKSEVVTEDCDKNQGCHIESHVKESNPKILKHDRGAAIIGRYGDNEEKGKVTLYPFCEVACDKSSAKLNQESDDRVQRQDIIHQQKPPGIVLKLPPGIIVQKEPKEINPVDQALDSGQLTHTL